MVRHEIAQDTDIMELAVTQSIAEVLKMLKTRAKGLTDKEVRRRVKTFGHNEVTTEKKKSWYSVLFRNAKDPLSALLLVLACISGFTGDAKATVLIGIMLVLSIVMRFVQELRADTAAEKLKAMVKTTVSVLRNGKRRDIALRGLVPGDIVHLSAGDMVPADVRILESRDLYVNQANLTGESMPVEKHSKALDFVPKNALDAANICFMGTNIGSGTATVVVIATGARTKFGALAIDVSAHSEGATSFDRGVNGYTWLMIRFIAVMVPAVFFINGIMKQNWLEAFLFAVAVAVGLTPEMLPVIVTVNLSKGAIDMSKKKVIVKRLNAIQDFGAMDVLCTDKTGTLTEGRVVLIRCVDIDGKESEKLFNYAFLNSYYQTGLKNLLDDAIVKHDDGAAKKMTKAIAKIDEIPFDFERRCMSVIVEEPNGDHLLICKGASEEILNRCNVVAHGKETRDLQKSHHATRESLEEKMSSEGFRVVAVAIKRISNTKKTYSSSDETGMTLVGFLAFLDPPKATATKAIAELMKYGVSMKILTGDNELVTRKICNEVEFSIHDLLLGSDVEAMSNRELEKAVEMVNIFAKLEPSHKERVIRAIQKNDHIVGFLGDGINDAPALKAADVGISVNSAVDIAKESSDIILTERSLMVLKDGVVEGRRAFGNIVKYIKMTASSNYGNMFSIVGASIFLPFLPMLPLQIIINNLMYDFSQASIPTDSIDDEYLEKPRRWDIARIRRFILWIGPVSSLFDYATFAMMLFVFNAWTDPVLFHTGWFVESLFTQTLIIHILRTRKTPFFQSWASTSLITTTVLVCIFAAWIPYSPIADVLGFKPLPVMFWAYLAVVVAAYFVLTQFVKTQLIKKYGWD